MDTTKKTYNSRLVFWIIGILMALMAAYMMIVIKTVPRTVESSKAGPFPALVDDILAFHKAAPNLTVDGKVWDKDVVNTKMAELAPYEGLAFKRAGASYALESVAFTQLDERPLLMTRLKHPEGHVFTVAMFAIAKRHFPKTRSFVHKDAWFFQYGKDLEGADAPVQSDIPALKGQGLNMIATNYGNDYYLVLVGDAVSKDLARWLFEATTIFSPKK